MSVVMITVMMMLMMMAMTAACHSRVHEILRLVRAGAAVRVEQQRPPMMRQMVGTKTEAAHLANWMVVPCVLVNCFLHDHLTWRGSLEEVLRSY